MAIIELTDNGLYCPAGDFYIDPWRPVPRAVITHAHADHARPGSGVYFAELSGIPLLRHRLGKDITQQGLAYGQVLELGRARVSLHSAGHILGSSQVRVEVDGEVWLVTGDFKRDRDPTCEPFEVVACDTLITEATFALPIYRWPDLDQVAAAIFRWCNKTPPRAVLPSCSAMHWAKPSGCWRPWPRIPTSGSCCMARRCH